MERKFTDDEIVKALECCCNNEDCIGCPCLDHGCYYEVQYSLDPINRQKAEIERLNKEVDRLSQCVLYHEGQIIDVVEEFAERFENELCEKVEEFYFEEEHENFMSVNKILAFVDSLVNEMTNKLEENNNER